MTNVSEPDGGSGPPVIAASWESQAAGKLRAAALAAPETPRQRASMDKAIFRMLFLPWVIFKQTWACKTQHSEYRKRGLGGSAQYLPNTKEEEPNATAFCFLRRLRRAPDALLHACIGRRS